MINNDKNKNFGLNFENIIATMQDDVKIVDFHKDLHKNNNLENNDFRKNFPIFNIEQIEESINHLECMNAVQYKSKNKTHKVINIHQGHRQRARERFLSNPDGITDRDLLELMLFLIIPRTDVSPMVYKLMDRFKSISNIYHASIEEINECGVNGVAIKYLFQMVRTINNRVLKPDIDQILLDKIEVLVNYCRSLFSSFQVEELFVLFLDNKLRLIKTQKVGINDTNYLMFSEKEIIKNALSFNATHMILTHNHPSDDVSASEEDCITTLQMKQLLSAINVKLIEHIIVGATNYFSFAEHNLL